MSMHYALAYFNNCMSVSVITTSALKLLSLDFYFKISFVAKQMALLKLVWSREAIMK